MTVPVRTAFFHGLPVAHLVNERFARSVSASFVPAYPDQDAGPRLRRHFKLLRHAWRLRRRVAANDVYLSEGLQFAPLLLRGLGRRRVRTFMIVSNETPYFLLSGRYGRLKGMVLRRLFAAWTGYLCLGRMEREIVHALVGADVHTVEVPGFVRRERYDAFQHIAPDLGGRRVLSIANGPGGFRAWYKGLDVMTAAVRRVRERQPDVVLDIVGNWTPDVVRQYEGPGIAFYEDVRDLVPYLRGAALYIQCGRGDAFAVAVLEAMLAGLPAVVSDLTGAREAVAEVASWLVVPSDGDAAAAAVERYLALSLAEREALSRRARAVAAGFSEERALEAFRRGFEGLLERTGGNGAVAR